MNTTSKSFVSLSIKTFKLFPKDQYKSITKSLILSIVVAVLEIISLSVIFPLLTIFLGKISQPRYGSTMNNLTIYFDSINWIVMILSIGFIFLAKNLLYIWSVSIQSKFLDDLYLRLANQAYNSFYLKPWVEYVNTNSSETYRKIRNTPYEFTQKIINGYFILIPEVFISLGMVCITIIIDYRIIFPTILFIIPVTIYYLYFNRKIISKISQSYKDLNSHTGIVLSHGINGFAEAKIYRKENYFIQKFLGLSKITIRQVSTLKTLMILPNKLVETISALFLLCMVIYVNLYPQSQNKIVVFAAIFTVVLFKIIPSCTKILMSVSQILAHGHLVDELSETEDKNIPKPVEKEEKISFTKEIKLKSITFRYNRDSKANILDDVSIKINKGDFIVLEGLSGSGKTTILNILSGLITNYDGQIFVDGIELNLTRLKSWQAKLGYVPQSFCILDDSILRNVCFGLSENEISLNMVYKALEDAGLSGVVNSYTSKLDTKIGENGISLSGGQRQRLILARVLYRDADVLLLDEITNQLDIASKVKILRTLKNLSESGKTIILASHDSLVKEFASKIINLNDRFQLGSGDPVDISLS